MSAATSAINTPERPGNFMQLIVAVGAAIFAGTLVARDAAGTAVPASDTAGLRAIGRAEHDAAAGESIVAKRGVFQFANSAAHALTAASLGKLCYVEDDNTVASTSTNLVVAGRVMEIADDGVWVDTTDIPIASVPVATSTNGTAAAAADLAALKTEAEKAGDDVRATITAIAS